MLLNLQDLLFYLFSLLTIASAFVVVTTPNPVHAVLFLVSAFAGAGCLLVLFGAEYLGVTFIVVYVGAVAIVFLFVIMMLNIKHATLKESVRGRIARYFPVGGIIAFLSLVTDIDHVDFLHLCQYHNPLDIITSARYLNANNVTFEGAAQSVACYKVMR